MSIIYELIPRETWITRAELVRLSGWSDRMIRREINNLRKNPDTVIISSSNGKGYKRPASTEELEMCRNEYRSRATEMNEIADIIDRAIEDFKARKKTESEQMWFDF